MGSMTMLQKPDGDNTKGEFPVLYAEPLTYHSLSLVVALYDSHSRNFTWVCVFDGKHVGWIEDYYVEEA